jgi:hypothetical protein
VQGVHPMGNTPIGAADPVALFRKTKPGVAVPQELLEVQAALAGAEELGDSNGPIFDEASSIGSGRVSERTEAPALLPKAITSDPGTFGAAFGCFFGDDDVFRACITNWHGNAFASARSRWAIYKMAPYLNQLTFHVSVNSSPRVALTIGQGGFWVQSASGRIHTQDNCLRRYPDVADHRLDILSSGEHHFSARFNNYHMETWSCVESSSHDHIPAFASTEVCQSHYGTTN